MQFLQTDYAILLEEYSVRIRIELVAKEQEVYPGLNRTELEQHCALGVNLSSTWASCGQSVTGR